MSKPPFLGATNRFPLGKLNADDEGELQIGIGIEDGVVRIEFGKPVAWIGLPPRNAIQFAEIIKKRAEQELAKQS